MGDIVIGLLVGFIYGLLAGVAIADAMAMLRQARAEWRHDHPKKNGHNNMLRNHPNRWALFVIVVFAATQVGIGAFQMIERSRLTDFIQCQADYNERTAEARDPRIEALDLANSRLQPVIRYAAETLRDASEEEIEEARENLRVAAEEFVEAQEELDETRMRNPYPAPPDEVCGEF